MQLSLLDEAGSVYHGLRKQKKNFIPSAASAKTHLLFYHMYTKNSSGECDVDFGIKCQSAVDDPSKLSLSKFALQVGTTFLKQAGQEELPAQTEGGEVFSSVSHAEGDRENGSTVMTVLFPSRSQLEEPREKKKCSFVHIVLCCCHAVSIFLDTKRSAKRKNAIDEPEK